MRLYLVRHAWAGEHGDPRWPNDADRPLTHEGKERFKHVSRKLAARGFAPQMIVTSPYIRARQTADILVKSLEGEPQLVEHKALEPGGDWDEIIGWLKDREETEIALVGHMPSIGELAAALIGAGRSNVGFAKGATMAIDFESRPRLGAGLLCWLTTAKLVGC
jgi:phosphohistidine phosphatase